MTFPHRLGPGWPGVLLLALALVPAPGAQAAEWSLCAPSSLPQPPDAGRQGSELEADTVLVQETGVSRAEGRVVLRTPDRTITSPRMEYDTAGSRLESAGPVTIRTRELFLESDRLDADLAADETVLHDARFRLPDSPGRGGAKRIDDGPGATVITDGSFTTCDPGSRAWRLQAKTLTLDHATRTGTARHARLEIRDLPVFYLPWISFPLGSERRTGFLMPSLGTSRSRGTTVTVPYYFNLAPNYDATLRLRSMSRRGEALEGRFRYLTQRASGVIEAEGLPEDRVRGEARSLLSLRHRHRLTPRASARVDYARASDFDYLRDLGAGIEVASTDHLQRAARIDYDARRWRFEALVQEYQTLKAAPGPGDPYRLLPRLSMHSRFPERNRRPNFRLRAELASFDHRSENLADGSRLDLDPSVSLPFRAPAGFFVPRAGIRYTGYDANNVREGIASASTRTVPTVSIDSGLYFDRDLTFRTRRLTQTLEPRLHYLWTPYRDQDRLPLFDAGSSTFGYDHLFRENRFSGTDRIGDANRITLALGSRLLHEGREVLALRFGQTRHFRERRVRLCTTLDPYRGPLGCPDDDAGGRSPRSTWTAAFQASPRPSLTFEGAIGHDGGVSRSQALALGLRFHPSPRQGYGVGWRQVPFASSTLGEVVESVDEVTESLRFFGHGEIGRGVRLSADMSHALRADRLTTARAGIEYDSCCWRVRLTAGRYLRSLAGGPRHENALLFEWELKGWTGSEIGLW